MSITKVLKAQDRLIDEVLDEQLGDLHGNMSEAQKAFVQKIKSIGRQSLKAQWSNVRLSSELQRAYTDAGFSGRAMQRMRTITDSFSNLISGQVELYNELGYENVTRAAVPVELDAIRRNSFIEMQRATGRIDSDIEKALLKAQFTSENFTKTVKSIEVTLDRTIGKLESNAYTVANTGLMSADRKISADIAAENDIVWFRYIGPKDKRSRDFCRDILEHVHPNIPGKYATEYQGRYYWHIDDIRNMDNNQGAGNVMETGGGYNCRHRWIPAAYEVNRALQASGA